MHALVRRLGTSALKSYFFRLLDFSKRGIPAVSLENKTNKRVCFTERSFLLMGLKLFPAWREQFHCALNVAGLGRERGLHRIIGKAHFPQLRECFRASPFQRPSPLPVVIAEPPLPLMGNPTPIISFPACY